MNTKLKLICTVTIIIIFGSGLLMTITNLNQQIIQLDMGEGGGSFAGDKYYVEADVSKKSKNEERINLTLKKYNSNIEDFGASESNDEFLSNMVITSSNENVIKIDDNNIIYCVNPGEANITIYYLDDTIHGKKINKKKSNLGISHYMAVLG